MLVCRAAVACQRRYARHRTRLRMDISVGSPFGHALLQRAVDARHGERRIEGSHHVAAQIGIAQQPDHQFGRHIIIQRESAAVGDAILHATHPGLREHALDLLTGMGCRGGALAHGGGNLVEHRLGVEVVALLHHRPQHLAERMGTGADQQQILIPRQPA